MSDSSKTQGRNEDADTASGGAPESGASEATEEMLRDESTDEDGKPLENPSGG